MKYTIKIPKPCNENWSKMTPTQRGMFVQIVKEVINYQYYSDNQLLKSLNESEKNL
jgi:mRNA-degrading endonuclease RelE of RelBE toxin-antitoxin system